MNCLLVIRVYAHEEFRSRFDLDTIAIQTLLHVASWECI